MLKQDTRKEIVALEKELTPTDSKDIMIAMINVMKIGTGNEIEKALLVKLFNLGLLRYMELIEGAIKNAAKNKSTNGTAGEAGAEDTVVGDTDQPDQVCERD